MKEKADSDRNTRAFEFELELEHPVETVWRALTDAGELARWFPMEARVEPGEGGAVWLGWQDPWFFDTEIEVWEPGRRLRLIERRTDEKARGASIAMDYTLEGRGGTTVLRFVHSGFCEGAEWDDEFDGISRGWLFELRSLRHYLDRHLGEARHYAWVTRQTELEPEEAAGRVLGPKGLLTRGSITGLGSGEHYTMRTAAGENYDGTVLVNQPPRSFAGIVPRLDDAIIRYEYETNIAVLTLSLWGDRAAEADAFEERWTTRLAALL